MRLRESYYVSQHRSGSYCASHILKTRACYCVCIISRASAKAACRYPAGWSRMIKRAFVVVCALIFETARAGADAVSDNEIQFCVSRQRYRRAAAYRAAMPASRNTIIGDCDCRRVSAMGRRSVFSARLPRGSLPVSRWVDTRVNRGYQKRDCNLPARLWSARSLWLRSRVNLLTGGPTIGASLAT